MIHQKSYKHHIKHHHNHSIHFRPVCIVCYQIYIKKLKVSKLMNFGITSGECGKDFILKFLILQDLR